MVWSSYKIDRSYKEHHAGHCARKKKSQTEEEVERQHPCVDWLDIWRISEGNRESKKMAGEGGKLSLLLGGVSVTGVGDHGPPNRIAGYNPMTQWCCSSTCFQRSAGFIN